VGNSVAAHGCLWSDVPELFTCRELAQGEIHHWAEKYLLSVVGFFVLLKRWERLSAGSPFPAKPAKMPGLPPANMPPRRRAKPRVSPGEKNPGVKPPEYASVPERP
jgi:hypothetical protein